MIDWREVYGPAVCARVEELDIVDAAHFLYNIGGNRAASPAWEQLGEVTCSVWLERAAEIRAGDLA